MTPAEQKQLLKEKLAGAGWEAPRLIEEIEKNNDVYFDGVSQVITPRWFDGRLGMIGDAAYCPTPLTGMGTSLAIIGAYLLAGELSRNNDYGKAFAAYEKRMRPYVTFVQRLPPGVPWLAHPKTRLGIKIFNGAAGLLASKLVQKMAKLFSGKEKPNKKDEIALPDFGN